jgi:BTB/POZ domain
VTIHVGGKRKAFTVHKKLICARSEYFAKVFNGGFKEAEGVMHLPEDDSTAFDLFINYVYQDQLPPFPIDKFPATPIDDDDYIERALFPLFCLAEKFCMNVLANRVMDAIQDIQNEYEALSSLDLMRKAYTKTHSNSKIRIYCVLTSLYLVARGTPSVNKQHVMEVADLARSLPDFAYDFVKYQWTYRKELSRKETADVQIRDDVGGFGRCFLHMHAKEEVCHLDDLDSNGK